MRPREEDVERRKADASEIGHHLPEVKRHCRKVAFQVTDDDWDCGRAEEASEASDWIAVRMAVKSSWRGSDLELKTIGLRSSAVVRDQGKDRSETNLKRNK